MADITRRSEKYLRYDIREFEEDWGVRGLEETRRHSCEDVLRRSSWQHLRSNDTCYEPVLPTDYHNLIKYTRSNPFTPAPELSWPITRSFLTWPLGPVVVLPPTSSKYVLFMHKYSFRVFYIKCVLHASSELLYILLYCRRRKRFLLTLKGKSFLNQLLCKLRIHLN